MNFFLGITGASGSIYAENIIENFDKNYDKNLLFVSLSSMGEKVFKHECHYDLKSKNYKNVKCIDNQDLFHKLASGTNSPDGAIIAPCSANSLGKISSGIQDNLLLRVASIMLKLKKPLILLIREMPYSGVMIENMAKLNREGAYIIPASPYFYHNPSDIEELISSVTAYIFKILKIENKLDVKWNGNYKR